MAWFKFDNILSFSTEINRNEYSLFIPRAFTGLLKPHNTLYKERYYFIKSIISRIIGLLSKMRLFLGNKSLIIYTTFFYSCPTMGIQQWGNVLCFILIL